MASITYAKPSGRGSYRDYYDAETKALVGECFAEDLEAFAVREGEPEYPFEDFVRKLKQRGSL